MKLRKSIAYVTSERVALSTQPLSSSRHSRSLTPRIVGYVTQQGSVWPISSTLHLRRLSTHQNAIMAGFKWILLIAFASLPLSPTALVGQVALELPLYPDIKVREATVADAAIISNITIEAFSEVPYFRYFRQFFKQYPHDAFNCLEGQLRRILTRPNVTGHIAFAPAIEPPHRQIPVSAAVWTLSETVNVVDSDFLVAAPFVGLARTDQVCKNRDVNKTRAIDFFEQFQRLHQRYLDDVYPLEQQLYLASIATLPAYQGHDIAGHVLRRGLAMVNDTPSDRLPDKLYATLTATPMGEPLYRDNGYESIKNITIRTLDDEERFRFDVMVQQLRP
jgi:ribosomal protein S18 acetylase RimI-like enzyme